MTNLSHCANSAATPTGGSSTSKSASVETAVEGHSVQGFMFGDMLATLAQEPETKKGETSEETSSDGPCEPCALICVVPAGRPEAMSRLDLSMFVATNVDNRQGLPCNPTPASRVDPEQQGDRPTSGVAVAPSRNKETTDLPAGSVVSLTPNPKGESPKHMNSPSPRTDNVALPTTDDGRLASGLSGRQPSPHVLSVEARVQSLAVMRIDGDKTLTAIASPSSANSDAWPESISKIHIPSTSAAASPIHIKDLATYFPAMIVRTAVNPVSPSADIAAITSAQLPPAPPPEATLVKILTFDLHPAALGPLTVRMRLSVKQVEIAIDVRSEDVRAILTQTRGAMVEALAEYGLTLEAPDIRLTTPLVSGEPGAAMNEQSNHARPDSFGQNQGNAPHDERSAHTRRPSQAEEQSQKSRRGSFDADKPVGVYL